MNVLKYGDPQLLKAFDRNLNTGPNIVSNDSIQYLHLQTILCTVIEYLSSFQHSHYDIFGGKFGVLKEEHVYIINNM